MIKPLDNWVYPSFEKHKMRWNITISEQMLDAASSFSLQEHCKLAVDTMLPAIGNNPAICFSGGIDSQTVIDSFLYAGKTPEVVIFQFNDDLNIQDVDHAKGFCQTRNIVPKIIDFDIIRFLNNTLYDFAVNNRISSPQFATHLFLVGKLKELGYTSAIFGGNNLCQYDENTWYTPAKEETDWYKYAKNIRFPIIGNFWLQDWRLSLFATLCMPFFKPNQKEYNYQVKINGYRKMGYDIIPQTQKFNGFESVKNYYEEMTGDGWTFEKQFRNKIVQQIGKLNVDPINLPVEIGQRINSLKQKI